MNAIPNLDVFAREPGYRRISVEPLAPSIGAEIAGPDLCAGLDAETVAEIRLALLRHLVIFFRDQRLSIDQHKDFGRCFGELQIDRFVRGPGAHPEIMEVVKEAGDSRNFAGEWHTDVSFQAAPALGSILYARDVPPVGGDTMFSNMYLAFEALSPGMRRMLDGMTAVHCAYPGYQREKMDAANARGQGMRYTDNDPRDFSAEHPVVRTHPETGRKALYVNFSYTRRFSGMTEAESRPLLDFLIGHLSRPEFTCRFRWRTGSLAFWDNRCAQHFPIDDYSGKRREMHRVTVAGDRPF